MTNEELLKAFCLSERHHPCYTSHDEAMRRIYHDPDERAAVATDSARLVAIHNAYVDSLAGKTVDKETGAEEDCGKFPNWKKVAYPEKCSKNRYSISFDTLLDARKVTDELYARGARSMIGTAFRTVLCDEGGNGGDITVYLNPEYLADMAEFGTDGWQYDNNDKRIYKIKPNRDVMVVMCVVPTERGIMRAEEHGIMPVIYNGSSDEAEEFVFAAVRKALGRDTQMSAE